MHKRKMVTFVVAVAFATSGCATYFSDEPLTVSQKIQWCVGMVAAGAGIGALVARDRGKGAAIGAGSGAAACGVWWMFQNQRDREQIAAVQTAAASTGNSQSHTWVGEDRRPRQLAVVASPEAEMAVETDGERVRRLCRPLSTTATVNGKSESMNEIWCRNSDGTWTAAPSASLVAGT